MQKPARGEVPECGFLVGGIRRGVAVAIAATGALSGAHLNPAISLAMWMCRGFPAKSALAYTAAQLVAAFSMLSVSEKHVGASLAIGARW